MMRHWPEPSLTADRVFSMSTSLDASTVTPGITLPDASRIVPVSVACANTDAGNSRTTAAHTHLNAGRIRILSRGVDLFPTARQQQRPRCWWINGGALYALFVA